MLQHCKLYTFLYEFVVVLLLLCVNRKTTFRAHRFVKCIKNMVSHHFLAFGNSRAFCLTSQHDGRLCVSQIPREAKKILIIQKVGCRKYFVIGIAQVFYCFEYAWKSEWEVVVVYKMSYMDILRNS